MVTFNGFKYVNKMMSNDKAQSPNFKSMSNDKCFKIDAHPLIQTQPKMGEMHNGKRINN